MTSKTSTSKRGKPNAKDAPRTGPEILEGLSLKTRKRIQHLQELAKSTQTRGSEIVPEAIDPSHYLDPILAPIEVIEAWRLGFHQGNALKYIYRATKSQRGSSLGRVDLIKAANYLFRQATGKWLPKELLHDKEDLTRAISTGTCSERESGSSYRGTHNYRRQTDQSLASSKPNRRKSRRRKSV